MLACNAVQAERTAHCQGVRPGKARVFTCLLSHIESADYSTGCRDQLAAQQVRRVSDWRLDYDLRQACKEDVPKVRVSFLFPCSCSAWHSLAVCDPTTHDLQPRLEESKNRSDRKNIKNTRHASDA